MIFAFVLKTKNMEWAVQGEKWLCGRNALYQAPYSIGIGVKNNCGRKEEQPVTGTVENKAYWWSALRTRLPDQVSDLGEKSERKAAHE